MEEEVRREQCVTDIDVDPCHDHWVLTVEEESTSESPVMSVEHVSPR